MVEESSDPAVTRRQLLRLGGVAVAGLAGCPGDQGPGPETPAERSGTPRATKSVSGEQLPVEYMERFDSIVDVAEAGADLSGSRPIDDVLRSTVAADTLLVFPDGQYRIDGLSMSLPDNVGMVAPPAADASLVPPAGEPNIEWFQLYDATDFLYDGIGFDFRKTGPVGGSVFAGPGNIVIRNLRVHGGYETIDEQLMRIDVTDEDGAALVENLVAAGVSKPGVNTTGLYVGQSHAGEITFRNCQLEGFSDNAIYASAPGRDGASDGAVHVRGGLFKNNNIAGIRIGSTGSTVKGATVIVDEVPTHMDDNSLNARGIRLRGRQDQVVENCRIVYGADAGQTSGALSINGATGQATIRDLHIEMNSDDTRAILAKTPERGGDVAPTFENVTVTGRAAGGHTARIADRPETTFRGCCIRQSGRRRHGIQFVDSTDCSVEQSRIDVPGDPIVLKQSSLTSGYAAASSCSGGDGTTQ